MGLKPTNRYSLWVGTGAIALVGAVVAAFWKHTIGLLIVATGVGSGVAMWAAFKTGGSTLTDMAQLDAVIGAGSPLLLEVFSDS